MMRRELDCVAQEWRSDLMQRRPDFLQKPLHAVKFAGLSLRRANTTSLPLSLVASCD